MSKGKTIQVLEPEKLDEEVRKVRETLAKTIENLEKARREFGGYRATLTYKSVNGDFTITVPIRHEKLKVSDVNIKTVKRTREGHPVREERIRGYTKYYDAETGRELSPREIYEYQVYPDGSISQKPIKRETSKELNVKGHRPAPILDEWFIEQSLEIWSEDVEAMKKIYDDLLRNDKVALITFQRGFNLYHALLAPAPYFGNDKIALTLHLVRQKKTQVYRHVMDIKAGKVSHIPEPEYQTIEAPLETI